MSEGVISGCEVTATGTPDTHVHVAAGLVRFEAGTPTYVTTAGGTLTPGTADTTQDRLDAAVCNSSGVVSVLAGPVNDAINAQPPDTTGYVLLAYVYVLSQAAPDYTGTITANAINADVAVAASVDPWTVMSKPAATSRASVTTVAADPDLQFAMAASTTYQIRGLVRWDCNSATPSLRYDFDGPTSPTRVMVAIIDCVQAGTPAARALENTYNNIHIIASATGNTPALVMFDALVENGTTAGTFSFRWSQQTSSFTPIIVRAGSYIEYSIT